MPHRRLRIRPAERDRLVDLSLPLLPMVGGGDLRVGFVVLGSPVHGTTEADRHSRAVIHVHNGRLILDRFYQNGSGVGHRLSSSLTAARCWGWRVAVLTDTATAPAVATSPTA